MRWVFSFAFSILIADVSLAQMDSLLLKGSKDAPQDAGLVSGRYEVRATSAENTDKSVDKPNEAQAVGEKSRTKVTQRKKKNERKVSSEANPLAVSAEPNLDSPVAEKAVASGQPAPPSVADQVKDLVLGKDQPILEAYKEQIHPDDVRLNKLEINVSPGFLNLQSKSTYSYRNYQLFSPYVALGAQIWLTPFIGVGGKYGTSLGADIAETGSSTTHIPVTQEGSELSLDFRRFFGYSRKSNSMKFGLYYSEYKFTVPGDNLKRVMTKSSGVGIKFESRFPTAPSYAWILGGKIEPRVSHTEQASGISLQSGASPQSSRVGLNIGGEFKLSRQDQIVWDLSFTVEKNQFNGAASSVDPENGLTPSGVSVTSSQGLFSLGYRWGH